MKEVFIMEIKKVCVLGTGTIGFQIAQQAAQVGGYQVSIRDMNDELVQNGLGQIKGGLDKFFVKKGKLTQEEADEIFGRIQGTTDLKEAVDGAELVIEVIPENLDLKKKVFKELDEICAPHTILASNSSSLCITEIASLTKRQDNVVGTHFFNPVAILKLLEVVVGFNTSTETIETIEGFAKRMNKEVVTVKDSPGFITTRLFATLVNEATKLIQEGVASAEDIDRAMKLGFNWPMGPLMAGDWNTEVTFHVLNYLRDQLGDEYRPTKYLNQMMSAGHKGRQVGRGFYEY
jgi:3-hydroxybutyryl-CoA dehydrogenase